MNQYHKIQTVFLRDPETKFKTLLMGRWAKPEFEYLKDARWCWTEKVDGTNIRVIWDGENVRFGGKTDDAQIPPFLLATLTELFPKEKLAEAFPSPAYPFCLYGEGYGARIQKGGGNYRPSSVSFILFDVLYGSNLWLAHDDVINIAGKLGIHVTPKIGCGTLMEAVQLCQSGFSSQVAVTIMQAEGLVMRPEVELRSRSGERVIAKIKYRDFAATCA